MSSGCARGRPARIERVEPFWAMARRRPSRRPERCDSLVTAHERGRLHYYLGSTSLLRPVLSIRKRTASRLRRRASRVKVNDSGTSHPVIQVTVHRTRRRDAADYVHYNVHINSITLVPSDVRPHRIRRRIPHSHISLKMCMGFCAPAACEDSRSAQPRCQAWLE